MSSKKKINSALWKWLQPLLPVGKPSLQGGRPRLDDELALNGILFVLRTGIAWDDLPQELDFGSGMTRLRRLREWQCVPWDAMSVGSRLFRTNCSGGGRVSPTSCGIRERRPKRRPGKRN